MSSSSGSLESETSSSEEERPRPRSRAQQREDLRAKFRKNIGTRKAASSEDETGDSSSEEDERPKKVTTGKTLPAKRPPVTTTKKPPVEPKAKEPETKPTSTPGNRGLISRRTVVRPTPVVRPFVRIEEIEPDETADQKEFRDDTNNKLLALKYTPQDADTLSRKIANMEFRGSSYTDEEKIEINKALDLLYGDK